MPKGRLSCWPGLYTVAEKEEGVNKKLYKNERPGSSCEEEEPGRRVAAAWQRPGPSAAEAARPRPREPRSAAGPHARERGAARRPRGCCH